MPVYMFNSTEFKSPPVHRLIPKACLWPSAQALHGLRTLVWSCLSFWQLLSPAHGQAPVIPPDVLSRAEVIGLYFTPPSDVAGAVMEVIAGAQETVLVQAYGFTHQGIAQALVSAHQRGVKVQVLLDHRSRTTNRHVVDILQTNQVPIRSDGKHAIAHNKVMVVDGHVVITGSFNFTNSAQTRNAENLLVLRSEELANSYTENYWLHWNHSQ